MLLLNLGCGNTYHKDWLNIDFISNNEYVKSHNLLTGIPVDSNTADAVYHSHILEHFSKKDGEEFINECYRVLKKDGIIRIAIPDFETIAREYLKNLDLADENDSMAEKNYEWITLELFDQMVRNKSGGEMMHHLSQPTLENEDYIFERFGSEALNLRKALLHNKETVTKIQKEKRKKSFTERLKGKLAKLLISNDEIILSQENNALKIGQFRLSGEIHQWMYDRYSLRLLLETTGFSDIKILNAFSSQIANWQDYGLDSIHEKVRKPDSLFMEATKK